MNLFRDFVVSFCTVTVCLGALFLLCPSGKTEKAVRYLLGLATLVCVLGCLPFLKNMKLPQISAQTETSLKDSETSLWYMKLVFETALRNNHIEFEEITVCTDISSDSGIEMYQVIVKTSASKEKIEEILGGKNENIIIEVPYE